jgi:microcin C transport system substrate-binding protein
MMRPTRSISAAARLRPTALGLSALGLAGLLAMSPMHAKAQETIVSHGISTFGDLKYPADMERLDYVNPDAPKGGEMAISWFGTFDSMNPYTRKGRAGYLSNIFFESMLTTVADEIGSSYCLLCETIEYPESKEWVIFTYELFLEEGLPSYRAVLGQQVASAEALDERRVKFVFREDAPKRDVIEGVGGLPIMSKAWFEANEAGLDESRLDPALGSGPYVLDDYDINQRIVYRRNPEYWGAELPMNVGRNNFDTIRVEYFGDSNAAFEGFKAGAYLFRDENSSKTWATGYEFPAVQDGTVRKVELADGTIATGQSFVMNLRRPQFQDPRVREALGLMFNFEWSNDTLFYGLYDRIESFWENTDLAAEGTPTPEEAAILQPLVDEGLLDAAILTDPAVVPPASGDRQLDRGNLREASRLLDEAGWTVGEDGIRRKDGQTLRVQILEDSPTFDRVINPYVQNLRALGVDAVYERVDPAQYTDRTRSHEFDMTTDQFPMSYEPGAGLKQYFGTDGLEDVFNSAGVSDPAVDRLIEAVMEAETREELLPAVKALDRVLRAQGFWIPQWTNAEHWVAYFDMYRHPDELPPLALGVLDFWWFDAEAAEGLRASGAL